MHKTVDNSGGACVIYARYSSHNQRDVSIEQQVAECEAYARSLGLAVAHVYADRAMSGTTDKRPQFQALLRDAARSTWSYVVTYKVDRFARNRYDSATYKYRLKRYGVRVLYAKESIPDGPEGILLESVLEGSAEYYSANLSQNIKRGMEYNARECKVNGGPMPYGYKKGPDGKYAVEPKEAETAREIFNRLAAGEQYIAIADDLNARGIPTKSGGSWNRGSFHRMIANPIYYGLYKFGDVRIEGGAPAIVPRLTYETVKARAAQKTAAPVRRRRAEYLLTGKLYCGQCGRPMVGVSGTSKSGQPYHYYKCQGRPVCSKHNVGRDKLERDICAAAMEYILQPAVIEWIADAVMEYQRKEDKSTTLAALQTRLRDIETATANVMHAIEQGIITATTKSRLMELETDAARIRDAIAVEQASQVHIERDFVVFWLEQFRGGDIDSPAFRRKILDTFVRRVELWDDKITIIYNYSGPAAMTASTIETSEPESSHKRTQTPPLETYTNTAPTLRIDSRGIVLTMRYTA